MKKARLARAFFCQVYLKQQLPIADIDPSFLLEARTLEVRDLLEAQTFMQRDARVVRQRDAADHRLHSARNVADLDGSIRFYTELFAAQPSVRKSDYAKWMLEDPRVNFAISTGSVSKVMQVVAT
ncbi:hypothetical protein [Noviluteimonas lactosilytica]|uniref:hypothetical protein n=1 Tax=Noviluteimonas lactosilytica TaxID=2888523 RepID=UPI003CCD0958